MCGLRDVSVSRFSCLTTDCWLSLRPQGPRAHGLGGDGRENRTMRSLEHTTPRAVRGQKLPMNSPRAVNGENSRAKVQNARGDSSRDRDHEESRLQRSAAGVRCCRNSAAKSEMPGSDRSVEREKQVLVLSLS